MSILLSAYFPEGIVFAADKNTTLLYPTSGGRAQDVEVGGATKVLAWPWNRAVVGYCGLGSLAGNRVEDWMRRFIAATADFDDLGSLAAQMRELVQQDFRRDHPEGSDVSECGLIIHLGGFVCDGGVAVPAMYHFSNTGLDRKRGYVPATRDFHQPKDSLGRLAKKAGFPKGSDVRPWLEDMYAKGTLVWFNNGLWIAAFNFMKEGLWQTLNAVREHGVIPGFPIEPSLDDRLAYCKMAVELYGSFFRHHFLPSYRRVGGGVDAVCVPWPEQ